MLEFTLMEEMGVVSSVSGTMATVAVAKKSMCEHCTAGTCHLTDDGAEIEAINDLGAEVGQRVRVELKPYTYLKGSIIVYGLPAVALVIGAVVGKEVSGTLFARLDPELVSALFAFGFLGLSLLAVKVWSMRAEKSTKYSPVIVEILKDT